MPSASCKNRSRASHLSWFLLFVLAGAQLAYAAHQFEHSTHETGETCAVCLQFDRNDDVPVDATDVSAQSVGANFIAAESPAPIRAQRFTHYASRASPAKTRNV